MIALSLDAAWGSLGWAIVTKDGPLEAGHAAPQGTWRWSRADRLLAELEGRAEAHALRLDLPIRLVVERPPEHYRHGMRSNDRVTLRALAELTGACALRGVARPGWDYPWEPEPEEWRAWWGLQRARRDAAKTWAARIAESHWRELRGPLVRHADHADDVAEAILLGVGACRHASDAPRGPVRHVEAVAVDWLIGGDR